MMLEARIWFRTLLLLLCILHSKMLNPTFLNFVQIPSIVSLFRCVNSSRPKPARSTISSIITSRSSLKLFDLNAYFKRSSLIFKRVGYNAVLWTFGLVSRTFFSLFSLVYCLPVVTEISKLKIK